MSLNKKHLVIVAGEISGDMHAAHLVDEIRKINPHISFSGLGGPRLRASGVSLYEDMTQIAVVGFMEILKHYSVFRNIFQRILKKITEIQPAAVILVDYPGFNLRLAKELKKRNIKVIYYISPQVWAWKEKRVNIIKKCVDKMLVLFEFEKNFYAQHDVDVDFVGHPFVDTVQTTKSKEDILKSLDLAVQNMTIGLLPGSRPKEVETMLPIMLDAASTLQQKYPHIQFLLVKAPSIARHVIDEYLLNTSTCVRVYDDDNYNGIHACDLCMVTSGTATLETALLNKPMIVVYRTSFLTWILARALVKIPYIGMVNIVTGQQIVPECIQYAANGRNIAQQLQNIFTDEIKLAGIHSKLQQVRTVLGEPGASRRAAQKILEAI